MSAPVRRFGPNPNGGRDLIVGDIHGCFSRLRDALLALGFDFTRDRVFSVGDLVDRGPESADALAWLQEPWFFAVRGNHEDMLVEYHAGRLPTGFVVTNGGAWHAGMIPSERLPYADAFDALPYAITLETDAGPVGIVHADCPLPSWGAFTARLESEVAAAASPFPGMVNAANMRECATWSRARFDFSERQPVAGVRAVVVGHNETPNIVTLGNVIYIDTRACRAGGCFTILDARTLRPAEARSRLDWSGADA